MLVKAFIEELPKKGDNRFIIRIPYFEGNRNTSILYTALLCNQPGEYSGYTVGDCVYVGFENERLNDPVIFGKLYIDEDDEALAYHEINELKVTNHVSLPNDTRIGEYSTVDMFKLFQKLSSPEFTSPLSYEVIGV